MKLFLARFSRKPVYWVLLLLAGLSLEAAALYYQYVLDEWPCVICIHIRIWIAAFMLVSLIGIAGSRFVPLVRCLHIAAVAAMTGFVERSYQVLAVERGWAFGDCDMDLGMPNWFALDKWLPSVFEVQTSCGYTPFVLFNITMAEILLVVSSLLLLTTVVALVFSFIADN